MLNSSPEKSNSSFTAVATKKPAAAQPKKAAPAEKPKAKPAPKPAKKTKEPWETSSEEDSVLDADTDDEDFSLVHFLPLLSFTFVITLLYCTFLVVK